MDDSGGILLIAVGLAAYFIPSLIGAIRKVPNIGSVIVINLLLGWTFIGWIVALAMAVRTVPRVHPLPPSQWNPPPGN